MGFNPVKSIGKAVGSIGKSVASPQGIGMIIGAALAAPTGGMSMAWGASLGGMAGAAVGGADAGGIAGAGLMGYAGGSMAQGLMPAAQTAAPIGGQAAPGGVFNASTGRIAGNVGAQGLNTGTGIAGLQHGANSWGYGPDMNSVTAAPPFNPKVTDVLPSAPATDSLTLASQSLVPAAAPTDTPFWESDLMKYGMGGALLAGMFEDPEYEDIYSPDVQDSVVDEYYEDVAEQGVGNVPVPASMRVPPPAALHNFGSKRSNLGRKRYAQGGEVDSVEALLTPGEFVMTKDAVRGAGGAKRMYALMDALEQRGNA